ncbi:hypothetical protein BSKO_11190 [Bryopsis sp. KO-2023]|nr:hypothetical protein BSKO_11190 [Bryopsis sp. KO-2023]
MEHPLLRHHVESYAVKDEDAVFWQQRFPEDAPYGADPKWSVFCLCDGHNGNESVKFLEKRFIDVLLEKLPTETVTDFATAEGRKFGIAIARAISETFETLDEEWLIKQKMSGTTVTIAVLHGWFLTVANVGDSLAYLHCNGCIYPMTHDHRISHSQSEQERLRNSGVEIAALNEYGEQGEIGQAPFGPLRAWPGGLAMGRSFGDLDVHSAVVSRPHITQIEIPPHAGARLVLASDGLWDCLTGKVALKAIKKTNIASACSKLLNLVQRVGGGFEDDTTVLILDILSQDDADLKAPVHPKISKTAKMADIVRTLSGNPKKRRKIPMPFFLRIDSLELDRVSSINDSAHGQDFAKQKMAEYMHSKLSMDSPSPLSSESSDE